MRTSVCCALVVVLVAGSACHSMRPSDMSRVGTAHRAWLTLADQQVILVQGPKVINDTIVGYVNGEFKEIPSSDVKQIRVKEWNRTETALLGAVGLAAFAAGAYAVTSGGKSTAKDETGGFCLENPDRCATDPNQ